MIALLLALSCGPLEEVGAPDIAARSLSQRDESLADCDSHEFPEMRSICLVRVGAAAAGVGDEQGANEACAAMPEGKWLDECHFRVGEELAKVNRIESSLKHCIQAGDYSRNCITHAAWGMPPFEGVTASSESALSTLYAFESLCRESLSEGPQGVMGEGLDTLLSRGWFNLYLGTGDANPSPAREATGDHAPHANIAWALETVRLISIAEGGLPDNIVGRLGRIWSGDDPPPPSAPMSGQRVGRYSAPIVPDAVRRVPHAQTFGGGARLVGETLEDDLIIAALEAVFYREESGPEPFEPYLNHPSDRVRWTAAKLFSLIVGQGDDRVNILIESEDRVLSSYVWEALVRNRTEMAVDEAR